MKQRDYQRISPTQSEHEPDHHPDHEICKTEMTAESVSFRQGSMTRADPLIMPALPSNTTQCCHGDASRLSWSDTFFEEYDNIIAVFDFDYDAIQDYEKKVAWLMYLSPVLLVPVWLLATLINLSLLRFGLFLMPMVWLSLLLLPLIFVSLIFFAAQTLSLFPCHAEQRIAWDVRSRHIAVTEDGVLYVKDYRETCCGLPCTDASRSRMLVRSM